MDDPETLSFGLRSASDPAGPAPASLVRADGPRAAAREAARLVAERVAHVLRERDWCTLALPGGHSMAAVYAHLCEYALDWSKVEFFFTDERCVHPGHPASAYGEADDHLFTNPRIGHHQVHRIEADRPDRELAALRYAEELPERFEVVLLELGPDGHVAGLFPNSPAFDAPPEEGEPEVFALETELTPRWRMTVGPRLLAEAEHVVVLATGSERAAAVRAALCDDGPVREVPGRLVRGGVWVVDRHAAAQLD